MTADEEWKTAILFGTFRPEWGKRRMWQNPPYENWGLIPTKNRLPGSGKPRLRA